MPAAASVPEAGALCVLGTHSEAVEMVLTTEARAFLIDLHRRFNGRRLALLGTREDRQAEFDSGHLPGFLPETAAIRAGAWSVAPIPAPLLDRRVEIGRASCRERV